MGEHSVVCHAAFSAGQRKGVHPCLSRLKNNPSGLAGSLLGMGTGSQPSWWEALHRIKAPVLLICGEWDEKFCAINQKVHNLLPSSKIEVVKQAGHTVHVEQPRIFGKIVSEFLYGL